MRIAASLGLLPGNIHTTDGIAGITFQKYLSKYNSDHPDELKKASGKRGESVFPNDDINGNWNYHILYPSHSGIEWTSEFTEHVGRWAELNGPLFDLLADSVRREYFIQPVILNADSQIQNVSSAPISLLKLLVLRYHYRIRTGKIDGAIDDLVTLYRWRYHSYQQAIPAIYYWENWFDNVVSELNIAANPDYPPTREQWERFERETSLPIAFDADKIEYCQKLVQLNNIQTASRGSFSLAMTQMSILNHPWHIGLDWNIVAKSTLSDTPTEKKGLLLYKDYITRGGGDEPFALFPFIIHRNEWQFLSRENRSICLELFLRPSGVKAWQNIIENKARFRKVLFAMEKYRLEHGTWPPAMTRDTKGRPLHSWRVLLLPYLGHEKLYRQIRLNEPWDSEYNRRFHTKNIDEYRRADNDENGNPSNLPNVRSLQTGETYLSVIVGKESLFDESGQGKKMEDYFKGKAIVSPAGIALIVPRAYPVCWMKPDEEVTFAAACKGVNYLRENRTFEPRSIGYRNDSRVPIGFVGGSVSRFSVELRNEPMFRDILTGQLKPNGKP